MEEYLEFEKLDVWHRAIAFADRVIALSEQLNTDRKHFRLVEQLESAATSIPLNIAEGKGRFHKKEYIQFLYYARGSAYELVSLLEIFHRRKWIDPGTMVDIKKEAIVICKMLNALIRSIK